MDFFKKNETRENDHLEQQVERGNLFVHTVTSRHSARINEIESFLYAVIDILAQKDIANSNELTDAVQKVRNEMLEKNEASNIGVVLRVDPPEEKYDVVSVNCEERLHICNAICCKLDFALSSKEVESGKVKWDLGRPYSIRQEPKTCRCVHMDEGALRCKIYNDRPTVCKKYSCEKDDRIWKDFEKMELNYEWIENNIKELKMRFSGAPMFVDQKTNSSGV